MTQLAPAGEYAGQMHGDAPQPDGRHALVGEADPADALPAFRHGIVIDAEWAELQLFFSPAHKAHYGTGF